MPTQGAARRNAVLFVAISLVAGFGGSAMALVAGVWTLDLTRSARLARLAGAGLYAWRGGHAVAALCAAVPALVAAMYAGVRLTGPAPGPLARQPTGVRAALAVLRADRRLRGTVALAAVAIAMSGFQTAATYAIVTIDLGLPATFLGVLGSGQGAGSIAGGLVVGRLLARRRPLAVGATGTVLFAAGCLVRCLPWWPATLASAVV